MQTSAIDSYSRHIAARAIGVYQRHISPQKGFSCAHRVLHRGDSCSQHTKRLIQKHGLMAAIPLIRQRFRDCKTANQLLRERQERLRNRFYSQEDGDDPEIPLDPPTDPPNADRDRPRRGSFRKPVARTPPNPGQNHCFEDACETPYCLEGCEISSCAAIDGSSFNCGETFSCGDLDCSSLHCGSSDCATTDCSSLDCGGADCSGCDFGSCT